MALIAKSGTPSVSSVLPDASHKITGLTCGEDVAAGDACYIASTGKVMRSNGTAANAAAKCDGFAAIAAKSGEAVTLIFDVNMHYGSGLTPGARYYVSATAGRLEDAATTGGTAPVAFAVDTTRVRVLQSRY